ncbi:MAG: glycerol-3-phosphate acyltransferase [Candidatus Cryosericum sp.]
MTAWELLRVVLAVTVAYMLGSIPTAFLVARRAGIDIRDVGDGNVGARNVARSLGAHPAVIVALADVLKGAAAVLIARILGVSEGWVRTAAWMAVIGHDFPLFLQFQGGQGLATTIGTLIILMPREMTVALGLFGALYVLTQNPDVGAGVGLGIGVFLAFATGRPPMLVANAAALLLSIPAKKLFDHLRRLNALHQP